MTAGLLVETSGGSFNSCVLRRGGGQETLLRRPCGCFTFARWTHSDDRNFSAYKNVSCILRVCRRVGIIDSQVKKFKGGSSPTCHNYRATFYKNLPLIFSGSQSESRFFCLLRQSRSQLKRILQQQQQLLCDVTGLMTEEGRARQSFYKTETFFLGSARLVDGCFFVQN